MCMFKHGPMSAAELSAESTPCDKEATVDFDY